MNPWTNQPLALWEGDPRVSMMLDWYAGRIDTAAVERWAAAVPPRQSPRPANGVGFVALQGIIMRRPGIIETMLGATSLDRFMASFRAALADPEVGTVAILVDSPGGEVLGITEAAAEIRAARSQKRISVLATDMAASAAFWLATQGHELVVTPSGGVGAIEVYQIHVDVSGALEQAGIKREVIAGGPYGSNGAAGFPLTDDERAHLHAQADEYYGMYVADVAAGRGLAVADVIAGYGQGRYLLAKSALAAGMVDRIDTLDGFVQRELAQPVASRRPAALVGERGPELLVPDTELVALDPAAKPEAEADRKAFEFEVELRRARIAGR